MERKKVRSAHDKFSAFLFKLLKKSIIGKFFTSYDRANERFQKITRGKKNRHVSRKNGIVKMLENNIFAKFIPTIFHAFLRITVKNYAMFLFTVGLITLPQYFLNLSGQTVFGYLIPGSIERLIAAVVMVVVSFPFLFYGKSLAQAILQNKLFNFITFGLLGVDGENIKNAAVRKKVSKVTVALILGLAVGLAGYFVNPFIIFGVVLAILFAYNVFRTPEIGIIVAIFTLPFANIWLTKIAIVYIFLCYGIKVILRKRVFSFEYHDVFAVLAILAMTACGIDYQNPLDSLPIVFSNLIIFMAYFLCANLVRSRTWFRKCIFALTSSAFVASIVGIVQLILGLLSGVDELSEALAAFAQFKTSVPSTFASNDVFAQYLMIAIPFGLIHLFSGKNTSKVGSFFITLVLTVALLITNSKYAFIGIVFAVILIAIIFNRNNIYSALVLIGGAIGFYFLFKSNANLHALADRINFFEDFNVQEKFIELGNGFAEVFRYPAIFGTGAGAPMQYDSFLIQFVYEYGIISLAFLTLFGIMFARLVFSHCEVAKKVSRKIESATGLCALIGLFVTGIFKNVWADERIMLLSIVFVALSFAFIKRNKNTTYILDEKSDITMAHIDIEVDVEDIHEYSVGRKYVHAPKNMKKILEKDSKNEIKTDTIDIVKIMSSDDEKTNGKKKKKKRDIYADDDVDYDRTNY